MLLISDWNYGFMLGLQIVPTWFSVGCSRLWRRRGLLLLFKVITQICGCFKFDVCVFAWGCPKPNGVASLVLVLVAPWWSDQYCSAIHAAVNSVITLRLHSQTLWYHHQLAKTLIKTKTKQHQQLLQLLARCTHCWLCVRACLFCFYFYT